jgi:hypothetical protein
MFLGVWSSIGGTLVDFICQLIITRHQSLTISRRQRRNMASTANIVNARFVALCRYPLDIFLLIIL